MTRLRIFTAALAASACFANSAMAADMYDHGSLKDGPIAPIVNNWDGFYIGAGVGGMVVDFDGGTDGVIDADGAGGGAAVPFSSDSGNESASVFGTVQIGYDRQMHSRYVVGLFADYDFSDDNDTDDDALFLLPVAGDTLAFSGTAEIEDSFTVGARFGFLATPDTLIYGLVGYTHAELNVSGVFISDIGVGAPTVTPFDEEDDLDAFTVGVGVETMLRQGLSLKVEYRYTDLDGLNSDTDLGVGATTGFGSMDMETDIHTVRAVLSYRPSVSF